MRLDVVNIFGFYPGACQCMTDQFLLRATVGNGETARVTGMISGATADKCQHRITLYYRITESLQYQNATAFRAHIAICRSIKSLAVAIRRQCVG